MKAYTEKLLSLLSNKERTELLFIFSAMFVVALVEMAGVASIMPFMAVVISPGLIESNRWLQRAYIFLGTESPRSFLIVLGFALLGFMILSNLLKIATTRWTLKFDNELNFSLAYRLLANYMSRPYPYFLNKNTAEMGKNVLAEVRNVIAAVLSAGMQVVSSSLVAVLILALLLLVQPLIAISITVVIGGAYLVVYAFARRTLARIGPEQVEANTMKYKVAGEALNGVKDLRILGGERAFLERFAIYAKRHAANNVTIGLIAQVPRHVLEVIAFGGILLIVIYFLGQNMDAGTSVSLLALYAFAGYRLFPAIQQIFSSASTVRVSIAALDVLHRDMTEAREGNRDRVVDDLHVEPPLVFKDAIDIRGVFYRYPESQEDVLMGIDIHIPANSSVGLVGSTGSGKTTTVDLVLGLLAPTGGDLVVDGVTVNDGNVRSWQRNLGYVPQSIFLCDDTIARNIALGVRDEDLDMAAVVRAAEIANLHRFIKEELAHGYGTLVGDRGIRLSGGQRQRIGIARALYRNPAVLIMDEATSALDGITEEAVMDALRELAGRKTIITIAHRLSTVRGCDVIYLLERGRVVASGKFDELVESSAWFRSAAGLNDVH